MPHKNGAKNSKKLKTASALLPTKDYTQGRDYCTALCIGPKTLENTALQKSKHWQEGTVVIPNGIQNIVDKHSTNTRHYFFFLEQALYLAQLFPVTSCSLGGHAIGII